MQPGGARALAFLIDDPRLGYVVAEAVIDARVIDVLRSSGRLGGASRFGLKLGLELLELVDQLAA